MKSWFDWRNLRRPKGSAPVLSERPAETGVAPRLRLLPRKRPLWARFGRKPSPFDLRPGAIESWMKTRPAVRKPSPMVARDRGATDRDGIGGDR